VRNLGRELRGPQRVADQATQGGARRSDGVWDCDAVLLARTYVDIVLAAGGVPVVLPPVQH
jgi:hypothetical protein